MKKAQFFAIQNHSTKEWVPGGNAAGSKRPKVYTRSFITQAINYWGHGGIDSYDQIEKIKRGEEVTTHPGMFDIHVFDANMDKIAIVRGDHWLLARA